MEFLNKLVKQDCIGSFRVFNQIRIKDGLSISVQGSEGHYCRPRKTISVDDYECMELAIFESGSFASVDQVTDNRLLIEKFEPHYEGTVYGYVPVEIIEELFQDLITK